MIVMLLMGTLKLAGPISFIYNIIDMDIVASVKQSAVKPSIWGGEVTLNSWLISFVSC